MLCKFSSMLNVLFFKCQQFNTPQYEVPVECVCHRTFARNQKSIQNESMRNMHVNTWNLKVKDIWFRCACWWGLQVKNWQERASPFMSMMSHACTSIWSKRLRFYSSSFQSFYPSNNIRTYVNLKYLACTS